MALGTVRAGDALPFGAGQLVSDDKIPVLWVTGPPGVGKTTVGWEVYSQLIRSGIETGYVDIDQLGICYPEPASDPGRHRLKARNLGAVIASFQASGARCMVVSGVVDAVSGVHVDELPHVELTVCRLRASHDELTQRFLARGSQVERVEDVLREADDLDASTFAGICVDTSGLAVAEVVRQVRERTSGWPILADSSRSSVALEPAVHAASAVDGPILWLNGATGVGKSTVGFRVYQKALCAGLMTAYVDLDQIAFRGPTVVDHRVRARSLAAMWQACRAAGAQGMVVVGPAEDENALAVYTDALPAATVMLCRLHATRDQLTERIMLRGQGGGWPQPGDPLRGQPTTHLLGIVDEAVADAEALESCGIGLRIDTDGLTVEEAANVVVAKSGWPGPVE